MRVPVEVTLEAVMRTETPAKAPSSLPDALAVAASLPESSSPEPAEKPRRDSCSPRETRASATAPGSRARASASVRELLGLRRLVDGGTPLTSAQRKRAESLIEDAVADGFVGNAYDAGRLPLTAAEVASLGLDAPAKPELPVDFERLPIPERMVHAQRFIDALTYNHSGGAFGSGETFFSVDKRRPVSRVLETARLIERDCLPIKCVEAVFLALKLTDGWRDCARVPAAFKTRVSFVDTRGDVKRKCHRHIVLFVRREGSSVSGRRDGIAAAATEGGGVTYGALGISRRASLAFREFKYRSVSEILTSYKDAYAEIGHEVLKVRMGLPAPRSEPPDAEVCWRHCCVNVRTSGGGSGNLGGGDDDGDDDDDDDDEEEEEATEDASSTPSTNAVEKKKKKKKNAAASSASVSTWEDALLVFEAHDIASRSRKTFDAWRVDGRRFAYASPSASGSPARGEAAETSRAAARGKGSGSRTAKPVASLEKTATREVERPDALVGDDSTAVSVARADRDGTEGAFVTDASSGETRGDPKRRDAADAEDGLETETETETLASRVAS